jgi:hypothetical protein
VFTPNSSRNPHTVNQPPQHLSVIIPPSLTHASWSRAPGAMIFLELSSQLVLPVSWSCWNHVYRPLDDLFACVEARYSATWLRVNRLGSPYRPTVFRSSFPCSMQSLRVSVCAACTFRTCRVSTAHCLYAPSKLSVRTCSYAFIMTKEHNKQ